MKKLLLLLIFIVSASGVIAQPGWNWLSPRNKSDVGDRPVQFGRRVMPIRSPAVNTHRSVYHGPLRWLQAIRPRSGASLARAEIRTSVRRSPMRHQIQPGARAPADRSWPAKRKAGR